MKIKLLLLFFITFSLSIQSQNFWKQTDENRTVTLAKMDRISIPSKFKIYTLNLELVKSTLQNAPLDQSRQPSSTVITFPKPDGTFENYKIYKAPVMEAGLSLKYPEIESYSGINQTNPSETIRFSITLFGLHAMIFSNNGTIFIDSYTKDLSTYIVYNKKDVSSNTFFECGVEDDETVKRISNESGTKNSIMANDGNFRTYRLAMACTIEYAAYHVNAAGLNSGTLAQKKAAVLSAMVVTMTRVNGIFEKDLALRMNLVANNDLVIFITTDNFNNTTASTLINQSQTEIDAAIGLANYDIGHTVSTGGGGLAQLFSPCTNNKARGITGSGAPVGDPFDIDYVAHEIGHQWGGNHTQNNNCNRSVAACVEPGSASTIMGYAGICSPNVQNNSDAYFHTISITEMHNFILGTGGTCATTTPNTNATPTVDAGIDYTIPNGTPFVLKGIATDADNDVLTYCWEQTNNQVSTQPPTQTATTGPNFRSISPSLSPNRYFPVLSSVIAGNLAPTWEVIPTVARTMNFALTVRDNSILNGAQTQRDDMVLNVASVGPFLVTSQNTAVSYVVGTNQTISWDVAGTTANGINCPFVDIFLSTDGGNSFPILLASKVPNDGSEIITIPNSTGTTNRIMIMGNNHIFYDVSNSNFSITAPSSSFSFSFSGLEDGQNKDVCQGTDATFDMNYTVLGGFAGTTTFTVSGNPLGTTTTFLPSTLSTTGVISLNISNTATTIPGIYPMTVTATSGANTKVVNLYLNVLNAAFAPMVLLSPNDLDYAQPTNLTLTWVSDAAANSYDFEIATDEDFNSIINSQNVTSNSITISGLNELTNYFWRVQARNTACFGLMSDSFRFTTGQSNCSSFSSNNVPLTISGGQPSTISSTLTIPTTDNVTISNVSVSVALTHTWIGDVVLTLISPTGIQIPLVVGQCGSNDGLNAIFDDSGTTLTCAINPAIVGTIQPNQPLSVLNGLDSQGLWSLQISDTVAGDGGSLTSWSLNICSIPNVQISCGQITTTWDGTNWSNGKPVENVAATINGNLNINSDIEACSLEILGTSQVVLQSNTNLTVDGVINVATTANFTIENNANLIQNQNVTNVANAIVKRNTSPLMRLDYSIWSSPVTGTLTLKDFSPNTLTNRFYNYNTTTNFYQLVANPLTQTFGLGNGYLIRMPDNHPTTPTVWNGEFNGNLNNGDIDVSLDYVSATQSFNMIGNPYPSTISAQSLLNANAVSIFGTLYFWRKINNAVGTAYASYTLGGATTTSPTSPTPNGTIQVGQGFFVRSKNISNPKVSFTNDLRVNNNSDQFFRTSSHIESHRMWLNLTNDSGLFVQLLAGYMEGATNSYDDSLDAIAINDASIGFTSFIANQDYSIQLKALPFDINDIFPLSFRTEEIGNYTISIDHVDGLFENTNQEIYLKDIQLQTIHNLTNSPYNFSSEIGTFNNRFEIVYQSNLANTAFENNNIISVYTVSNEIIINSSKENINNVTVYDLLGRTLYFSKNINQTNKNINNLNARNQALLVKITIQNGQTVVKKIVL